MPIVLCHIADAFAERIDGHSLNSPLFARNLFKNFHMLIPGHCLRGDIRSLAIQLRVIHPPRSVGATKAPLIWLFYLY